MVKPAVENDDDLTVERASTTRLYLGVCLFPVRSRQSPPRVVG